MGRKQEEFVRRFEGKDVLDGLLSLAGSQLSTEAVLERMAEAVKEGQPPSALIPTFFPEEPRFSDPSVAKKLYENLFGLWDLVLEGAPIQLEHPARAARTKRLPAPKPLPFGEEGPDAEYVEAAWRYLEDLDERSYDRLSDSFENRQDALLGFLDEHASSDETYGLARELLFDLYAMIEVGWTPGVGAVKTAALEEDLSGVRVPQALKDYIRDSLSELENEEEGALSQDDTMTVQLLVNKGLAALWAARKAPGRSGFKN